MQHAFYTTAKEVIDGSFFPIPARDERARMTDQAAPTLVRICPDKKLRILDRATRAFLTSSFDGTNLEDIAIASGVSKVTIYQYFGDKKGLFEAVVVKAVQDMAAPLRRLLQSQAPVEDVLNAFAECYVERMIRPVHGNRPFYEMARTLVGATVRNAELAHTCEMIFARDLHAPLVEFLQERVDGGEIELNEDCAFLAKYFFQSIFFTNAVALNPESAPASAEIETFARRSVRLFLFGCRKK